MNTVVAGLTLTPVQAMCTHQRLYRCDPAEWREALSVDDPRDDDDGYGISWAPGEKGREKSETTDWPFFGKDAGFDAVEDGSRGESYWRCADCDLSIRPVPETAIVCDPGGLAVHDPMELIDRVAKRDEALAETVRTLRRESWAWRT